MENASSISSTVTFLVVIIVTTTGTLLGHPGNFVEITAQILAFCSSLPAMGRTLFVGTGIFSNSWVVRKVLSEAVPLLSKPPAYTLTLSLDDRRREQLEKVAEASGASPGCCVSWI